MHEHLPGTYSLTMDRSVPVVRACPLNPECEASAGPPPYATASILSVPEDQLNDRLLDQLVKEGYSSGLIQSMAELQTNTAKQIWLIDDSGSMITYDGTRMAESPSRKNDFRFVKCSRWEELQDCVSAHIKLSGALRFPTSFRFLNGWESFGVCESPHFDAKADVKHGLEVLSKKGPDGPTPLKNHITAIYNEVAAMEPYLRATGQHVSVVICTDGLPSDATDDMFIRELRRLEDLPVWIVIRLCTDEVEAVDFYNRLDAELEVPCDVIDDFRGEGIEVATYNPWLNYAMPLHHVREMGVRDRVLDLIDERPLSPRQQKRVCELIFGEERMSDCPDPAIDWLAFLAYMDSVQAGEQLQWDPIRGKMQPWVDFRRTKPKQKKAKKMSRAKLPGCFAWR